MDSIPLTEKILEGKNLSAKEAGMFFTELGRGMVAPQDMMRTLFLLNKKGVTTFELLGAARAFRNLAKPIKNLRMEAIDNCGTGGDGKDTFNISTAASFVIAACGVPVAKHGNRGVSSKFGSADLLQALGINIEASPGVMLRALEKTNFGYFHAPLYHAAMRSAIPFRKAVRSKTIFNILGPLLNPLGVKRQLIGTFSRQLLFTMAEVLKMLGTERATLVHGMDGTDEVSISGPTEIVRLKKGLIHRQLFHPNQLGIKLVKLGRLRGGSQKDRVRDLHALFEGRGRPALEQAVALNAAFGIQLCKENYALKECFAMATQAMKNGAALNVVRKVREITNG